MPSRTPGNLLVADWTLAVLLFPEAVKPFCRVGGQRVAVWQYVSNRPSPNRTCTFQRIRLSS